MYYTLALLAVLTVALSPYQNRQLTRVFLGQIEFIKRTISWTGRLLELRQAASAVEEPANYVIGLKDVRDGPEKMRLAQKTFEELLSSLRQELAADPDGGEVIPGFKVLNEIEAAMTEMVAEGEQMFSCLEENRLEEAAHHRIQMRRKSGEIVNHLVVLHAVMLKAQQERLEKDLATNTSRKDLLYVLDLLALFLVFGVTAYGVTLSRRVEIAEGERENYEEALRKSNDELDMRVQERTAEITKANETLRALIAERQQVEEKLRRSEELFRLITENVADFIIVLDLEGRPVYSSPSYKGMLGDPQQLGRTVSFNDIHPDDRETIKRVFKETIRAGIGQRFEHRFVLKNGSIRYMESQGSVIRDENGKAINVVVVSRDITRRKRVEETLRQNEDRFRLVVQATNDAVWDWDLSTNLFWWNEGLTTLFGYARDEAGTDATWWTEHVHPEDQERVISGIYEQIDGDGKSWSDEYRFQRKDGSYAYIFDRGYVIRDDSGKPLRIIGAKMDVSERKKVEEEIKQLNEGLEQRVAERTAQLALVNETLEQRNLEVERMTRLKSQFLASMSHELRTPLNAIIGFADLLQDGTSGTINDKQKKFVKHVQLAGRHLLDLINDILDLSKIEAGQLVFQPENFSADGALPEVLSVIKPLAMKKHIELRNQVGPGLNVYADRVRFKQIIYNLLSNAVKFTPEGGQVNVESLKIENFVRFSVADSGVGIRPEDHEAIFEEFRQVGQATSGVTEGTGLGLAISKRLVVQQEGAIWVESAQGKGSRFSFTLPVARSISRVTSAPFEPAPIRPAREKPLILVVDEEAASLELLVSYLSPENFQTEIAISEEEGLTRARELQPDAVILDILSNEEDRWATLCELKTNPATAHIPIIIVSVLDKKNEGFAQGASEYFVKPVSKEILVKRLFRHLPSQHANLSTVLVIDDHPNALNLINDALETAGYSPFVARNGKEAQDVLWRIRVDAILLDLMYPEIDGVELLRRVRENPRLRKIPVIVLAAKDLTGAEAEGLKRNSRAIICKDAQWRQELISQLDLALGKQVVQV